MHYLLYTPDLDDAFFQTDETAFTDSSHVIDRIIGDDMILFRYNENEKQFEEYIVSEMRWVSVPELLTEQTSTRHKKKILQTIMTT